MNISTVTESSMLKNEIITINSRKFDNSLNRSWKCNFLEESSSYWLFVGEFESEIHHQKLGIIRRGTVSYEYYWKEKWFNIFRFHEPEGDLKFYYCNINLPPKFENNVLDYVDLDIDVLVQKDFTFEILDEDEFAENAKLYNYPENLKMETRKALESLLEIIRTKSFPFNLGEEK